MKLQCTTLILDLDGTISDPSLGIARCFNYALEQHHFPVVPEHLIAQEIGPPLDASFLKLAPGINDTEVASLVAAYRARYADIGYAENTLYPGIPDVLEPLYNSGLRLGLCTSKRVDFAKKILSLFDLSAYFEFVNGGEIGITKGMQLAELIETGVIDEQAIMVGDRDVDINAAHQNNLRAIGVLWGFGDRAELSNASPLCILEDVGELAELIL